MRASLLWVLALGVALVGVVRVDEVRAQEAARWPSLTAPSTAQGGGERDAAVIVGVEDYAFVADVPGAAQNAVDWAVYFHKTRKVPLGRIKLLTNKDGTKEKLRAALQDAARQVKPGGTLWFVFIGHGAASKDGTDGILVGSDADQDAISIYARSLARAEATKLLARGRQGHTVMVLDTCFSGRTSSDAALASGLQPLVPVRKQRAQRTTTVFAAGASDQLAGPLPGAERPAFSYLMLGALRGWADSDSDGKVTTQEAHDYAHSSLSFLLAGSRAQTPELWTTKPGRALSAGRSLEAGPDVLQIAARFKTRGPTPAPAPDQRKAWSAGEANKAVVEFTSEPSGAAVLIDGAMVCQATPCSKALAVGTHRVEMNGDCVEHKTAQATVKRGGGNRVFVKLNARRAGLEVEASNADHNDVEGEVYVDGVKVGMTPGRFTVPLCAKEVEVKAAGYTPFKQRVTLKEHRVDVLAVVLGSGGGAGSARRARDGMVYVEAGAFIEGSNAGFSYMKPQGELRLDGFWIDRYEVTVEQYAACVQAGVCTVPTTKGYGLCNWKASGPRSERLKHPINGVDWEQARAYCAWRGKRLPTEAEWEKAARGTDGRTYPWGNAKPSCKHAVMKNAEGNGKGHGCGENRTWEVGSKPDGVSPYGAHDMAGNVSEWTADGYKAHHDADAGHRGEGAEPRRVVRGGDWTSDDGGLVTSYLSAFKRSSAPPSSSSVVLGFRCAGGH